MPTHPAPWATASVPASTSTPWMWLPGKCDKSVRSPFRRGYFARGFSVGEEEREGAMSTGQGLQGTWAGTEG